MRVTNHPILENQTDRKIVTIYFDGRPIEAYEGEPVAAALINAGVKSSRKTPKTGQSRGIFCAIGRCTDCMMIVDGRPNTRTCITSVKNGMKVETQIGRGGRKE